MSDSMGSTCTKAGVLIAMILAASTAVSTTILPSFQQVFAVQAKDIRAGGVAASVELEPEEEKDGGIAGRNMRVPIATSGDNNVYIAWWSNKTGNNEVMFKASTDGGKTFGNKMNLSNSPNSQSQDVQIAASGNNVYITWWERNATSNEPVLKVSNDNGKTFGDRIMLSAK